MPLLSYKIGLICCLIIFLHTKIVWGILKLSDFQITEYYLGSSKVYSQDHENKPNKRELPVSSRTDFLFDMKLSSRGKTFTVYIKRRKSDILKSETSFIEIFNNNTSDFENSLPYKSCLYEGYILDEPGSSSVNGYVKDEHFYGHIIIKDSFYYVDELKDPLTNGTVPENNAIIFNRDSIKLKVFLNETTSARDLFKLLMKQNYFQTKFRSWKGNGMLCPLIVVIDNSFVTTVHNSNVEASIYHVLFSLEEANSIFRSTDFDEDGTPDNIGFYVKKVVVLATAEPVHFIPSYEPVMRVEEFLLKFARYEELPKYCLGIVFTAQRFEGGTLGVSFTPDSTTSLPITGICEERVHHLTNLNALVITASTLQTFLVKQILFEVTITHELGHSFGAVHDTKAECAGHLMAPKSFLDYDTHRDHSVFSSCSKLHILRILVMKGNCMEPVQSSFCGNGIVEDGEDCDCGLTWDCLKKDPCCIPRRSKEYPCKINKKTGFQCHPSQGECCTNGCKYSEYLEKFLHCKHFDKTCPCTQNESNCACGLYGTCIQDECHSIECTRIQLKECQCLETNSNNPCIICCQHQNDCISAMEATEAILTSEQGEDILKNITLLKQDHPVYKTGQFIARRFCVANKKCINLQFFRATSGKYCLHQGQLGKCQPNTQCKTLKSKQTFPSFESASRRFSKSFVHLICYLLLNGFLIHLNGN